MHARVKSSKRRDENAYLVPCSFQRQRDARLKNEDERNGHGSVTDTSFRECRVRERETACEHLGTLHRAYLLRSGVRYDVRRFEVLASHLPNTECEAHFWSVA